MKFNAKEDGSDGGRVELAYAHMARAAGLDVPEVRLFETSKRQAFFGVRRFDRRPGNRRLHVHSLGGLLQANFRVPGGEHQMSIDGEGAAPTREGCLALAERHGVTRAEGARLLEQVNDAVSTWRNLAKATGCRVARTREIAAAHRPL